MLSRPRLQCFNKRARMNLLRGAVARAQLLVCWLSRLGTLPALLGDAPPGVDAPSPLPRLPFGLCLTTGSSLSWQPFLLCFSEWDSVAVGVPSALSFDSVCIAATLSSCASVVVVMIAVMASFFPTLWIWASECLQDRKHNTGWNGVRHFGFSFFGRDNCFLACFSHFELIMTKI